MNTKTPLALLFVFLTMITGCQTDTGDQTANRLKDLPFTIELVGEEYLSRYQRLHKPSSESGKAAQARKEKGIQDEHGKNDIRIVISTPEQLAADILIKLRLVPGLSPEQQVDQLVTWLQEQKKTPPETITILVNALQKAAKQPTA